MTTLRHGGIFPLLGGSVATESDVAQRPGVTRRHKPGTDTARRGHVVPSPIDGQGADTPAVHLDVIEPASRRPA